MLYNHFKPCQTYGSCAAALRLLARAHRSEEWLSNLAPLLPSSCNRRTPPLDTKVAQVWTRLWRVSVFPRVLSVLPEVAGNLHNNGLDVAAPPCPSHSVFQYASVTIYIFLRQEVTDHGIKKEKINYVRITLLLQGEQQRVKTEWSEFLAGVSHEDVSKRKEERDQIAQI